MKHKTTKHTITMVSGRTHLADLSNKHVIAASSIARDLRQEKPGSIDLILHTFENDEVKFTLNINHIESIVPFKKPKQ